jgi:hypothetical protein
LGAIRQTPKRVALGEASPTSGAQLMPRQQVLRDLPVPGVGHEGMDRQSDHRGLGHAKPKFAGQGGSLGRPGSVAQQGDFTSRGRVHEQRPTLLPGVFHREGGGQAVALQGGHHVGGGPHRGLAENVNRYDQATAALSRHGRLPGEIGGGVHSRVDSAADVASECHRRGAAGDWMPARGPPNMRDAGNSPAARVATMAKDGTEGGR